MDIEKAYCEAVSYHLLWCICSVYSGGSWTNVTVCVCVCSSPTSQDAPVTFCYMVISNTCHSTCQIPVTVHTIDKLELKKIKKTYFKFDHIIFSIKSNNKI